MAKKSKKEVEATESEDAGGEENDEDEKPAKKSKKDKKSKKASKSEEKTNGNVVTLKQLAGEAECTPQVARQKLRAADIEREDGSRWQWEKGSKDLKKARDALGL